MKCRIRTESNTNELLLYEVKGGRGTVLLAVRFIAATQTRHRERLKVLNLNLATAAETGAQGFKYRLLKSKR